MVDMPDILNKIDDYSNTIKGIAGLINDMQMSDGSGGYIYSEKRYVVLERVLLDMVQNMDKLCENIESQQ